MSLRKIGIEMKRYEVDIKETVDGELFFNIPDNLLDELKWKEGDELKFIDKGDGSFLIKKKAYETVELEFDDDELFKYMKHAHEQNMSFNEWVECVMEKFLKQYENNN